MKNRKKYLFYIFYLLLFTGVINAQQITGYEYFIDNDLGIGNGQFNAITPLSNIDINFNVDLSNISLGIHNFYVRVKDNTKWSQTYNNPFYNSKSHLQANISKVEYFIDTDPGYNNAISIPLESSYDSVVINFALPLNNLSIGIHSLYTRANDNLGNWSLIQNQVFYVEQIQGISNFKQIEYFIDNDPGVNNGTKINLLPTDSFSTQFVVNLNNILPGIHNLYVRVQNEANQWSMVSNGVFLIENIPLSSTINYAEYYIDADPGMGKATSITLSQVSENVSANIIANLANISMDSHTLHVRVRDNNGLWSNNMARDFKVCPFIQTTINNTICSGDSLFLQKKWQKISGMYYDTLQTVQGCDSIVKNTLTVLSLYKISKQVEICGGESYTFGSQLLFKSGEYTEVFKSSLGCDSTVSLNLKVSVVDDSVTFDGNILTAHIGDAIYQWLDCGNNNFDIVGAISQSYSPTKNGNYAVKILKDACASISECTTISLTDIDNGIIGDGISVFPNPNNGEFTLNVSQSTEIAIYNELGNLVYKIQLDKGHNIVNIRNLNSGLYLLKAISENKQFNYKISILK